MILKELITISNKLEIIVLGEFVNVDNEFYHDAIARVSHIKDDVDTLIRDMQTSLLFDEPLNKKNDR